MQANPEEARAAANKQTLSTEDLIDSLCDSFESSWKQGAPLPLDTLLESLNETQRATLFFELLAIDATYRGQMSCSLDIGEYLQLYPKYKEEIHRAALLGILTADSHQDCDPELCWQVGEQLKQYELVEKIGWGASSEVWKARDHNLHRIVAVKIPHAQPLTEDRQLRFLQEAHACARFEHPNIVSIYEIGRARSRVYLVSQFIEGRALNHWIGNNIVCFKFAAELCATVAEALHYAHGLGIIHRDLKPANILLDSQLFPYVTDFGLAKSLENPIVETLAGQILGTPAYMSPEQVHGEATIDQRSDTYSLGVVLYEMLTGQRPFEGDVASVLHKIARQLPRRVSALRRDVPADLEAICHMALEKEPAHRYQSAHELSKDLRRYLAGAPVVARRAQLVERGVRTIRRRKAIIFSATCAVSAALSIGAAGVLARRNRDLLGLKSVSFSTTPTGAHLSIFKIDPTTAIPDYSSGLRPRITTPLTLELPSGYYLIVARFGNGRFHEVFRTVPSDPQVTPVGYSHLFWEADSGGTLLLPTIAIPVTSQVECSHPFTLKSGSTIEVNCAKFTIRDYLVLNNGRTPPHLNSKSPDSPHEVHYDEAVSLAEACGKRLPTFSEYREIAEIANAKSATSGLQIVTGLFTGIPEWTSTIECDEYNDRRLDSLRSIVGTENIRTVCGRADSAIMHGNSHVLWANELRGRSQGIGFRCVRSRRPII